ncbi:MAG: PLP-dependent aminotransferase family protein [Lachnospiraceae bacterium]
MLTYDLSGNGKPMYEQLYDRIREDILTGKLLPDSKMPSKRMLAGNLGVSIITVENAYELLISEGYLYAIPKVGYYVENIADRSRRTGGHASGLHIAMPESETFLFDFSSNSSEPGSFPFSVWAKLMRETISCRETELLKVPPSGGIPELRAAIADYLSSFRGMSVDPDQIIVGAGTEYLYGLLIQLLGRDKTYCVENPGYRKIKQIYESNHVSCVPVEMDEKGLVVDRLLEQSAQIAHVSPTHHFPTGITMPASRRYELLRWADGNDDRYIIEDEYDSEFRMNGKPVPTLFSMDSGQKVIYMNTFSKSLTATIRISYMILPETLANLFYRNLDFYSCTVSTFEQYTLAEFIARGYFEKHINRMRLHYKRKREQVLRLIREIFTEQECRIIEKDSGLHFILEFHTSMGDRELEQELRRKKIRISAVTDYDMNPERRNVHQFILNYSGVDTERLKDALEEVRSCIVCS